MARKKRTPGDWEFLPTSTGRRFRLVKEDLPMGDTLCETCIHQKALMGNLVRCSTFRADANGMAYEKTILRSCLKSGCPEFRSRTTERVERFR